MALKLLVLVLTVLLDLSCGLDLFSVRPEGYEVEDQSFWNLYGERELWQRYSIRSSNAIAKNVIFFLGDGMGLNSVTTSRIYKGQKEGKSGEEGSLVWDLFPYTGLSKTYNTDYQVPDSAGTASAIFSGVKTRMGVVGIDGIPPRYSCDVEQIEEHKLTTMLNWAQEAGKDTGIVTTARIMHASPAALFAHSANRNWEYDTQVPEDRRDCWDITKQLVYEDDGQRTNVLFGGGKRNYLLTDDGGKRSDEDLLEKYKSLKEENGKEYQILETTGDLKNWDQDSEFVLGLFADSHMPYELDRDTSDTGSPSIEQMVTAAVNRLSKNKKEGFFLFVEGARIDHGHHANDAHRAFEEAVQLENAVIETLKNPNINLDETLIIVTADHSHSLTFNGYPERGNSLFGYVYDEFRQNYIPYKDGTKMPYPTLSYANGNGYYMHRTGNPDIPFKDIREMDFNKVGYLQPAAQPGPENEETHGGEDVGVYAIGPMSHMVVGVHEESYLGHLMAYAACVGRYADNCDYYTRWWGSLFK